MHPLARIVEGDRAEAEQEERRRRDDGERSGGQRGDPGAQVRDTK
ncbi:MAG: hypothetical protein ABW216_10300 [Candidatus Rokuibacteriota bacterium]